MRLSFEVQEMHTKLVPHLVVGELRFLIVVVANALSTDASPQTVKRTSILHVPFVVPVRSHANQIGLDETLENILCGSTTIIRRFGVELDHVRRVRKFFPFFFLEILVSGVPISLDTLPVDFLLELLVCMVNASCSS